MKFKRLFFSKKNSNGLTLIELLISIAASSIIILGVYRLLTLSLWSYNSQEQMTDLYQNGTFTIKKLSEIVMQAGSDLPGAKYKVITMSSSNIDSISMKVNPRGGKYKIPSNQLNVTKIVLPDARGFIGSDSLVKDSLGLMVTSFKISKVDTTPVAPKPDTITIATAASFYANAVIYGSATRNYYCNTQTVYCKDSVVTALAENIDSVAMLFYTRANKLTTNWDSMLTASIYIRAKTLTPDPKYKHPVFKDGYRRLPLSMAFRLKNRF